MNDNHSKAIILAARETSVAIGMALEAVRAMKGETWAQREQRLADGRGSPTGWPIERLPRVDDGLTIPERRALIVQPPHVERNRIAIWLKTADKSLPLDAPSYFDGMSIGLQIAYILATGFAVFVLGIALI